MIKDIIQTAVIVFDKREFTFCSKCPQCGGDVQGYDTRSKKFATVMENEKERIITVRVKRFTCKSCRKICYADSPFYPHTHIGSPVIDLFCSLSTTMPASRAARIIDMAGIIIDRTTWKNYRGRKFPDVPVVEILGMRLPVSIVTLSNIASESGETGIPGSSEILDACGYPSAYYPGDIT